MLSVDFLMLFNNPIIFIALTRISVLAVDMIEVFEMNDA